MTRELDKADLISKMIGKDFDTLKSLASTRRRAARDQEAPVMSISGLTRRGSIEPTTLDFYRGEVIGFAGLLGSGRTELARLLFGADKPEGGAVRVKGEKVVIHSPAAALSHQIALSSENRRDEGIIKDLTVRENIILALQVKRGWLRPLPRKEQDGLVAKYLEAFAVRPADPERQIGFLSGGNQQKVLLGRWLATDPEVLILDEPTRGIDVGAKADIQEAVAQLASAGVTVIFISSELEEVVRLCDRIVVLKDHRVVAVLENGPDVSVESIVNIIAKDERAA
jgi:simple sugar transport system ATP-binding protein